MDHSFEGAAWADNHQHLSAGISRLFKSVAYVFHKLNEIEYAAPWRRTHS